MSKTKQFSQPGLPLTPPVLYILLSLSLKQRHGYEILKHVQEISDGAVRLGPGTLYNALKRLREEDMIAEVADRPREDDDDARRRYYRLTDHGRQALATEVQRLERALALIGKGTVPRLVTVVAEQT